MSYNPSKYKATFGDIEIEGFARAYREDSLADVTERCAPFVCIGVSGAPGTPEWGKWASTWERRARARLMEQGKLNGRDVGFKALGRFISGYETTENGLCRIWLAWEQYPQKPLFPEEVTTGRFG